MVDVTFDTTLVVDLIRKIPEAQRLANRFLRPAISHVVLGEVLVGGMKSGRPNEMHRILLLLSRMTVIGSGCSHGFDLCQLAISDGGERNAGVSQRLLDCGCFNRGRCALAHPRQ